MGKNLYTWVTEVLGAMNQSHLLLTFLDPGTARFRMIDTDLWRKVTHESHARWLFNSLFSNFSCQDKSQPIIYEFMSAMRGSPYVERCWEWRLSFSLVCALSTFFPSSKYMYHVVTPWMKAGGDFLHYIPSHPISGGHEPWSLTVWLIVDITNCACCGVLSQDWSHDAPTSSCSHRCSSQIQKLRVWTMGP